MEANTLLPPSNKAYEKGYLSFLEFKDEVCGEEYQFLPNQEFCGVHGRYNILHKTCGRVIEMSLTNFVNVKERRVKTGCKKCARTRIANSQRYSREDFREVLLEKFPDWEEEYELVGEYVDTNTKIEVLHKTANHTFKARPRELLQGNGCAVCGTHSSKVERSIAKLVTKILGDSSTIECNKKGLFPHDKRLEVDILIPNLKCGIEVNGDYWHSEKYAKMHDAQNKVLHCKSEGFHLITISDSDWAKQKPLYIDKLKYVLGKNNFTRIYARNCDVFSPSKREKGLFLHHNNLDGTDNASFTVGLKDVSNGCIVALLTADYSAETQSIKLSRFCIKRKFIVPGGFSKLLKALVSHFPDAKEVIARTSLNYSVGEVYSKNGFVLSHTEVPKPNYYGFKGRARGDSVKTASTTKSELRTKYQTGILTYFSEDDDIETILLKNDYLRVYDCGSLIYIKPLK